MYTDFRNQSVTNMAQSYIHTYIHTYPQLFGMRGHWHDQCGARSGSPQLCAYQCFWFTTCFYDPETRWQLQSMHQRLYTRQFYYWETNDSVQKHLKQLKYAAPVYSSTKSVQKLFQSGLPEMVKILNCSFFFSFFVFLLIRH